MNASLGFLTAIKVGPRSLSRIILPEGTMTAAALLFAAESSR